MKGKLRAIAIMWIDAPAFYDLRPGNGVGSILTAPEPTLQ